MMTPIHVSWVPFSGWRRGGGRNGKRPGVEAEALVGQIKMDAETGSDRQLRIACRG
jgi:hypothetical protein